MPWLGLGLGLGLECPGLEDTLRSEAAPRRQRQHRVVRDNRGMAAVTEGAAAPQLRSKAKGLWAVPQLWEVWLLLRAVHLEGRVVAKGPVRGL